MPQYSELENAIQTLVSQFYGSSKDNSPTLKVDEFKGMLSSQLPNLAKGFGSEQGLSKAMQLMGVGDGEGISFQNFWNLIQDLAKKQHCLTSPGRGTLCKCVVL
ncbi:S100-A14 [Solea senegalensis]|uniref:S100-A14 n=1 Tax=Solea senegalensis TaxID=28829 RepID=A0AAV6R3A3_SOLSE|nr:S100 calcium binding protein V2 [Solea senegalensis]KAG7499836.1 S100-A14 [Solea senegalensis]